MYQKITKSGVSCLFAAAVFTLGACGGGGGSGGGSTPAPTTPGPTPSNVAPTVVGNGVTDKSIYVGTDVSFSAAGAFQDTGPLTYTISGQPNWLLIGNTGTFSGSPTASDVTTTPVTVTVTARDSGNLTVGDTFMLTVLANNPPRVVGSGVDDQTPTAGSRVNIPTRFSDTDTGDSLTYSISGAPAGVTIDRTTGVISGIPTVTGSYTITVTARDRNGEGAEVTDTFRLTVDFSPPPPPPVPFAAYHVGGYSPKSVSTWERCEAESDGSAGPCRAAGTETSGTGAILIKDQEITARYLHFLMTGGGRNSDGSMADVGLKVFTAGSSLTKAARGAPTRSGHMTGLNFSPNSCDDKKIDENDDWKRLDMGTATIGQTVDILIYDNDTGSCGFIAFDHIFQSDDGTTPPTDTATSTSDGS